MLQLVAAHVRLRLSEEAVDEREDSCLELLQPGLAHDGLTKARELIQGRMPLLRQVVGCKGHPVGQCRIETLGAASLESAEAAARATDARP